ncbi:uncharacterized protein Z520_07253 [Fonsecaea multimorphosa CBS 102226]|uniref:Uncharacterized protein n=1 Tax=Fonsecaea multimorphosa CBS 102226 TaxID=1442371 RepID=A0A0D2K261_9EURO|nr:uncharacterized protein Z520_07253 [Fonsecaea multimorphosa CBS 102226]KIX97139.1 hypothetical protein Z520_07253 [Fonsecaea multimorphosa CBS 102226]OAL22914.1 hypothetical protein AYO22_06822 [Fonsecaea multimorphosa]
MNGASVKEQPSVRDTRSAWRLLQENPSFLYTMILCNPVLVLHSINGLLSFLYPAAAHDSIFDTLIQPHVDAHAQDGLCHLFTLFMVALQSALYSSQAARIPTPSPLDGDTDERAVDNEGMSTEKIAGESLGYPVGYWKIIGQAKEAVEGNRSDREIKMGISYL